MIEEISTKLIELGYTKRFITKPNLEDFKPINEIDFIDKIADIVGDINSAKSISDSYNEMILNETPDIVFNSNDFDIEIFLNNSLVEIRKISESKPIISSCGLSVAESLLFKKMNLNDFHKLLVQNDYGVDIIFNGGNN